jgi:hypothetical protein
MKEMKSNILKRRRRTTALEFAVRAKDESSEKAILSIAEGEKITPFRKGHAVHRLYFRCDEEQWRRVHPKIRRFCNCDGFVSCPPWFSRAALKGLRAAEICKISPDRASRAKQLLEWIAADAQRTPVDETAQNQFNLQQQSFGQPTNLPPIKQPSKMTFSIGFFMTFVQWLRDFVSRRIGTKTAHLQKTFKRFISSRRHIDDGEFGLKPVKEH